ncbi:BTB/POZ domain-containing protein At3g19850-like [Chenopodium quinoa]|uniref:BTB/POZ domain-containing protein At3g19850-like n=1 Tax=Chenopodium quinoa TaxID=63459 RepID=UPI000B77D6D8|nr:BTB/POZ domain-containing protein At3g19850-like [Chenopodium quinoa]
MADQCDLQIHINGQQTFFLNQKIVSAFSGKLRKLIKQEKKRTQIKKLSFTLEDFPGGSDGFELISRFCYNNGRIPITVHNVCQLYCASIFLSMTDKFSSYNLLQQSETFLDEMFHWSWGDVLECLRTCEPFFTLADSSNLIDKLITTLLAKIAQNSDISLIFSSNSSSSSSPDNTMSRRIRLSNSSIKTNTPDLSKPLSSSSTNNTTSNPTSSNTKAWWFDDLATLSPMVIERVIRSLGAFGSDNNSLLLTKFALHYLKTALQSKKNCSVYSKADYSGVADTAVYGVILMGRTAFSCRALFWVMRLVTGFGLSRVCRSGLERLIGSMLDLAKLDDLLVSGHSIEGNHVGGVYDVNLVIRLIRVFVHCEGVSIARLKKVGWLVDQYLAEISPDQNLKISKFIGVAQSLPDSARDCFDGVYRAIDIYLESHPTLSFEERSRLCRCLNYEKLSLEACKDLAKNPRIPPRVAVQALASQKHANYEPPTKANQLEYYCESPSINKSNNKQIVVYGSEGATTQRYHDDGVEDDDDDECISQGSEEMKLNMQRMQWRVLELENLCKEMKSQMSKMVKHNKSFSSPTYNRPTRLC